MEEFELINGQRSGKILIYQNYLFNLKEEKKVIKTWRCRTKSCNAKLIGDPEN